jgi:hypothetical protein
LVQVHFFRVKFLLMAMAAPHSSPPSRFQEKGDTAGEPAMPPMETTV